MIEKERDVTIEWFPFQYQEDTLLCISLATWGAVIFDGHSNYHIAHVTMPKWWPNERQVEVAQNLVSLIELRRTNHD